MPISSEKCDYVLKVAPKSGLQIESEAMQIIKNYYPHLLVFPQPFDVLHFFDHVLRDAFGLDTGVAELPSGTEGVAWGSGKVFVTEKIYSDACDSVGRARFTILHESYHGLKHVRQVENIIRTHGVNALCQRLSIQPFRNPEWQADRFAASLLMPAKMIEMIACGKKDDHLMRAVVDTFQVSAKAARIRTWQVLGVDSEKHHFVKKF